ncbi:immunoglobulin-like domain-containing receptor 2 isoform X5 [Pogona vitticeps]|uniref:immunoglobulin-like domain-containing receptor 2 isoform X5 n=1 Tax=Pogona vitticeps TaxID=103695 RepID=UPI0009E508D9|nr:immunoglobulin-like domain-containing receptor 2 isoform X4 [Pogona vitticeps]
MTKMDGVLLGWAAFLWVTAVTEALDVMVPEKKRVAMLFQPVVLRCHFSTSSTQPAVIQWRFKSYCQDRMGEALGVVSAGIQAVNKRNLEWDPYLDCLDNRRTVRAVASKQGSSVTIGEFYKGRDVTIVHDADLHIGKLMWGDSGLYYCLIITPDDVEGKNEESVELLVLVRKGYRIQTDKDRDSMKVLYYVEKELAQFDPARRMRERYNNTISELSSLHDENGSFRQPYRQVRRKPLPPSGDMDGDAEYWAGVVSGGGMSRPQTCSDYREERGSFKFSQQRSKSEMLSRKSFSLGMPAVSMDELAAFAESYSQHARHTGGRQESRRFERSGSRGTHGGSVQHPGDSDNYYSKRRGGNREPLTDSGQGWAYSPSRRHTQEEKHLPRLVCRTPGGSQKHDHSYLTSALERKSRSYDEGGEHNETPSKLSSQSSQRGGTYYAWSPPSTYQRGQQQPQQQQQPPQQEEGEDTLPPYSEMELNRGSSYRSREQSNLSASDKKRKKEPKKTNEFPTRMSLVV